MATWDKTRCAEGILAPDLNDEIRLNQEGLEEILGKEHNFTTGGPAALQGIHKQGAARCFWQATAPGTRADGSAFTSNDLGALWIDSDDNKAYILTVTTPVWTVLEGVTIATLLAAARTFAEVVTFDKAPIFSKPPTFTEGAAANNAYIQARNQAGDDNIDMIKVNSSDKVVIRHTAAKPAALLSTDPPVSDQDIANKKYVDDQVAGGADPTYSGGESHTFPGGLIQKMGSSNSTGIVAISFGSAFTTAIISVVCTPEGNVGGSITHGGVYNISSAGFTFELASAYDGFQWQAIGH